MQAQNYQVSEPTTEEVTYYKKGYELIKYCIDTNNHKLLSVSINLMQNENDSASIAMKIGMTDAITGKASKY